MVKLFILYYDHDYGDREEWNTFYTPMEIFQTEEERSNRIRDLAHDDPDLSFYTKDVVLDWNLI